MRRVSLALLLSLLAVPASAQTECRVVGHPGDPNITRSICRVADARSFECSPVFDVAGAPDAASVGERAQEITDLLEIGTCASARDASARIADPQAFTAFAEVQGGFTRRLARLHAQLENAALYCRGRDPALPDEGLPVGIVRAVLAAARQWTSSIPPELRTRHCHALFERLSDDVPASQIVDIDLEQNVTVDTAYYRTGTQYIVVRNIDPTAVVDVIDGGREGMPVGEVALRIVSVAMGGQQIGADDRAAEEVPSRGQSGFVRRVFAVTMRPGEALLVRTRSPGESAITEVASGTNVGFVIGAALAPLDVVVQFDGQEPFGQLASDEGSLAWNAADGLVMLSVHAFAGIRFEDELFAFGLLIVSTTGDPLRGISLHYGHRFRSLSQAMYLGVFAGMRWASRPDVSMPIPDDTRIELIQRRDYFALSVGVEILFDLASALSNPQGILSALF
jgi:hypothetical protein